MENESNGAQLHKTSTAALTLAALGVVYGDIGTSPLYTIKEIFHKSTGVPLNPETIVGAVSVVFWALMLVVTLKYVVLILRADNRGEGGIMALLALASQTAAARPVLRRRLLLLGAFGACLFYGDSVITPAISVLSAVEGLEIVTPALKTWVLPLSMAILVGLFIGATLGYGRDGPLVRADHRRVVPHVGCCRPLADRAGAGDPAGARSAPRLALPGRPRLGPVPGRRRRRAGRDRNRSALRRHGAFRQATDPSCLDRLRAAVAGPELHRPGGAAVARPRPPWRTRSTCMFSARAADTGGGNRRPSPPSSPRKP